MDIVQQLRSSKSETTITTVDFHTAGEATRIVISGFPKLTGSLLSQRRELQEEYDHLRRRIILEPRGHWDMYGAFLINNTDRVQSGEADIGVLFMTNDGWSTMCGHATIALGRFLVDTQDTALFPHRADLPFQRRTQSVVIRLHAPCGIVQVTVPTDEAGLKSDASRPVEYDSVPSFPTALDTMIQIPQHLRWPELGQRTSITLDFAYGGAFYGLVDVRGLGFVNGLDRCLGAIDIDAMRRAADAIIQTVNQDTKLRNNVIHSVGSKDLEFLYSVIIADTFVADDSATPALQKQAETGLCFFADSQIDRSPTGSGVQARIARAYARNELSQHRTRTYHSLLTRHFDGNGAFQGSWVREVKNADATTSLSERAVIVRVSGHAFYTGTSTFVFESGDRIGERGFSLKETTVKL